MKFINYATALKNQEFDRFEVKDSKEKSDSSFLGEYESPKLKFCLGDKLKFHFSKVENA